MSDNPLGEFLRARRERVDPADVGLRAVGTRRTPGLRREEVAALAGISVEYLVRLERGRDRHPSAAVVDALGRALRLDDDGRTHLGDLADPRTGAPTPVVGDMSESLERLIAGWSAPTIVTNAVLDLIGMNETGRLLHEGIGLTPGVNMARALFLTPGADRVYVDFDKVAAETVGNLRALAGGGTPSVRLIELVGELSVASPVFASLWASGEVLRKTSGIKTIEHPAMGRLDLEWSTLAVEAEPGQLVVAYQAIPGTRAEGVLAELATYRRTDVRTRGPSSRSR
ncbi:MAG: helix-turn-helix transcriptional regulator [Gordonia paraffinivorans]